MGNNRSEHINTDNIFLGILELTFVLHLICWKAHCYQLGWNISITIVAGISWYILVYPGISWYILVYPAIYKIYKDHVIALLQLQAWVESHSLAGILGLVIWNLTASNLVGAN